MLGGVERRREEGREGARPEYQCGDQFRERRAVRRGRLFIKGMAKEGSSRFFRLMCTKNNKWLSGKERGVQDRRRREKTLVAATR